MLNFLASILLYAIPVIVFIHIALEVYRRNLYSVLNKIAAISKPLWDRLVVSAVKRIILSCCENKFILREGHAAE